MEEGTISLINKDEPKKLGQFAAHFVSESEQAQACNFAIIDPFGEDYPLQVWRNTIYN